MLIHSWNIQAGGGTRIERILRVIAEHGADTLVLNETTHHRLPALLAGLRDLGFTAIAPATQRPGERGVLIASKQPFAHRKPSAAGAVPPHRWCEVWFPDSKLRLAGLYFPHDAPRIKALWPRVHEAALRRRNERYLLVGDLNSGQTAFDAESGTLSSDPWFTAMPSLGMTDLWRHRNRDAREYTWLSPGRSGHRVGFRIDHAFGSASVRRRVRKVWYSHTEREDRTSDHSSLLVAIG